MKKRYDLIVALGGDGSCSKALGLAGLQHLPFPFDDMENVPLSVRADMIVRHETDAEGAFSRLDRHVGMARAVLLVWADVPSGAAASEDEWRAAVQAFRSRWGNVAFDLVAFRQKDGSRLGDYEIGDAAGIRTVSFDYRNRQGAGCDARLLGGWLRKEYTVPDYRTQDELEACRRERLEKAERNLRAMGPAERTVTRIERAVFMALKRHLTRLGVIGA